MTRMIADAARWACLALGCGLVAACGGGTTTWQKEGVAAEDRQRDIVDCRRQADAQAEREAFGAPGRAPVYELDRATGAVREVFRTERRSAALSEKARSQELYEDCMRARGYRAG